jgi:hypothetical protein
MLMACTEKPAHVIHVLDICDGEIAAMRAEGVRR